MAFDSDSASRLAYNDVSTYSQVVMKKRDLVIVIGWVLEGHRGDWPYFGSKGF
jgi:hypothetical protein